MIFIDSNIPMYLVGGAHPHKVDTQLALERCSADSERMVTDAEVLQESLHRYTSIRRPEAIDPAIGVLLELADQVLPVEKQDVLEAKLLLGRQSRLSSRDAIHWAIMRRYGVSRILSFDGGFDDCPGVQRVSAP